MKKSSNFFYFRETQKFIYSILDLICLAQRFLTDSQLLISHEIIGTFFFNTFSLRRIRKKSLMWFHSDNVWK